MPGLSTPYIPNPKSAPLSNKVDAGDSRKRIIAEATKLVGTQEKTGHNDGPAVDRILASVGLEGSGAPWCAAANRFIYDRAGLKGKAPRSALASDWVKSPTWKQGEGEKPLPGDTWGIYFQSKGRVAHTGIVDTWGKETVITLEGNTSPEAVAGSARDREGEGYWRKRRAVRQIYAVKNWLK